MIPLWTRNVAHERGLADLAGAGDEHDAGVREALDDEGSGATFEELSHGQARKGVRSRGVLA